MQLTRPGWGLLATGGALFLAGRFFGALELHLLAGMALVAVLVAVVLTATRRLRLSVDRQASPSRLRAGSPARIDLAVENRGRWATPVLRLHDRVGDHGGAVLHLSPIPRGETTRLSYRLPTDRRGPLPVGPLELSYGDPLNLTTARFLGSTRTELLVFPALVELTALRAGAGTVTGTDRQVVRSLAPAGDEFFALRPYVLGDELKRVHWRNSARIGELVVRQEERPRQGQVVVVLDVRRDGYDEPGFERAVSAADSALHAAWAGGDAVRFLTSNAGDSGPIAQRSQLDAIEERLARISPTPAASVVRTIEDAARGTTGGSLVVVTGRLTDDVVATAARARRTFGVVVVITCQHDDAPPVGVLVHDGHADLASQWDLHLHRQRSSGRARRAATR
jgi:uncharacterized protein (DUF58 family)